MKNEPVEGADRIPNASATEMAGNMYLAARSDAREAPAEFKPSLPADLVDGLDVVRNVRDTLHYLEAEPGEFNFAVLGGLLNHIEQTVVPEVNAIANDLSWPALRLEP
jgi:hypothetical protein